MEWLNYHHLLYFYMTAREGSVARASQVLRLAQPTISGQIRMLEESLDEKLFERSGRGLRLTEVGRVVYQYAEEIFALGSELRATVRQRAPRHAVRLTVGVADALPKLITAELLAPALRLPEAVQLVCREDRPERLFAELAAHQLDVVLSDVPLGPELAVRAYNHLLGDCGLSLMGAARLAAPLREGFPGSLDGAPMLLPAQGSSQWRTLFQWLEDHDVRPRVVGECSDPALTKILGMRGLGVFVVPTVVEEHVTRTYGVELVARLEGTRERFYAVSIEKRIHHPAVLAITQAARQGLFAALPSAAPASDDQ